MESQLTPYTVSAVAGVPCVLVLAPHPDDEVFGCGGTLALHVMAGTRVHVVICTSGDVGGVASVREAESRQASRVLGYSEPLFWGLPDRGVVYSEALVQRIVDTLVAVNASILYAPSLWENHPDHRAVALAALEAVRRSAPCELMCYEVGAPLRPDVLIDITPVLEKKRAAMACFPSQLAFQRYDRHIEALNVFRSYTLAAEVLAAEAFERHDMASLRHHQATFFTSEYSRQQARGLMTLPDDMPLVSVLLRSMDRRELDRALDSVAVQTWCRVEVVVVNAKGPGHRPLPAWCGRFPMRLIDSEVPLHRSAAANRALAAANGDALLLLDDDDWLDAGHIHKLANALQSHPEAVAAVTGTRGLDANGVIVHEWKEPVLRRLMLVNQMPIMSVLFRKNTKVDAPRFDDQLDLFEDWDFWLQVHLQGQFVHVPGISATYLIRYRAGSGVHEAGPSQRAQAQLRAKWRGRWPDAWLDALRTELDEGIDRRHVLEAELNTVQHRLEDAEQERIALCAKLDEGTQALAASHLKREEGEQARHSLADRLDEQAQALAASHRQLDDGTKILSAREEEILLLTAEKTSLNQQFLAQMESAKLQSSQQRADANTTLTSAKQQRNAVTHELLLMRQKFHEQSQELMRFGQFKTDVELHIQALIDSRSWRITAPMRSLGTMIRKWREPRA